MDNATLLSQLEKVGDREVFVKVSKTEWESLMKSGIFDSGKYNPIVFRSSLQSFTYLVPLEVL